MRILDVLEKNGGHEGIDRIASVLQNSQSGSSDVGELGRHHGLFAAGQGLGSLVEERVPGIRRLLGEAHGRRGGQRDGESETQSQRVRHRDLLPHVSGFSNISLTSSS